MKNNSCTWSRFSSWIKHARLVFFLSIYLPLVPPCAFAEDIAILKSADIAAYSEAIDAFKQALPESFNVAWEFNLQGNMAKGRSLARRIRASNAHAVLVIGLKAALAAKLEILDIPVIMCLVLDPEKYALPSGNMVGLSLQIPFDQQLKPLQALIPKLSRIGVLFDPEKTQGQLDQLKYQAGILGMTVVSQEAHSEQDVSLALKLLKNKVDALYLLPDSTILTENTLDFLISSTLEAHIPLIGFSADLVRSGAVSGTYLNYADLGRYATTLVPQVLMGTPSSLVGTMVRPAIVRHAINVKSARYLGLSLTPEILRFFDEHY